MARARVAGRAPAAAAAAAAAGRGLGAAAPRPAARRGPAPARGQVSVERANLAWAVYAGGYGVCLMANPEAAFGAEGLVPYFTAPFCGIATFFARMFGAALIGLGIVPYMTDKASKISLKMALAVTVLHMPLFIMVAMNPGALFAETMWKAQCVIHAALIGAIYNAGWM